MKTQHRVPFLTLPVLAIALALLGEPAARRTPSPTLVSQQVRRRPTAGDLRRLVQARTELLREGALAESAFEVTAIRAREERVAMELHEAFGATLATRVLAHFPGEPPLPRGEWLASRR